MTDKYPPLDEKQKQHFLAMCQVAARRKRCVALIVEDSDFSKRLLEGMLQDFETFGAGNGRDAWEIFIDRAPDIVFLDIELPDISGHELAIRFIELHRKVHIVMVSGRSTIEDIDRARRAGISTFIAKPYTKQRIQQCIDLFRIRRRTSLGGQR
jgi:two-component system chemotaxis response regulator CheY